MQRLPAPPPPPLKAFGRSKAHHQLPCVWRQERNVGYRMIRPDDYVVKKNAAKTSLLNKLLCVFSVSVCLQIHNLLFHFFPNAIETTGDIYRNYELASINVTNKRIPNFKITN